MLMPAGRAGSTLHETGCDESRVVFSESRVIGVIASPRPRCAPSTLEVRSLCEGPLPDWSEVVASSACSSSDQAFMSSR